MSYQFAFQYLLQGTMLRNSLSRLLQSRRIIEPARNVTVLSSLPSQKFGMCSQVSQSSLITNTLWSTAVLPNTMPQYTSKRYSGTDASLFKRFIKKMGLLKYSRTVSIFLRRLCMDGKVFCLVYIIHQWQAIKGASYRIELFCANSQI